MRDPLDDREVDERFAEMVAHWADPTAEVDRIPPTRPVPEIPADRLSGDPELSAPPDASRDALPRPTPRDRHGADEDPAPGVNRWHPRPAGPAAASPPARPPGPTGPPGTGPQDEPKTDEPKTDEPLGDGPRDDGSDDAGPGERQPVADPLARLDPQWRMPTSERSFDELLDAEEDEGFTPGPVALPPPEDVHYWGALLGLIGGPLVILYVAIAEPFYRGWWLFGGLALTVAGFLLLVMRMPAHRDPEDDDDGARV